MTQNHRNSLRGLAIALIVTASAGLAPINAKADQRFQKWIADFYQTAAQNGISKATYRKAFSGVSDPDPTVLEKAAYQPEFTTKIWDYVDSRVNPYTVQIGRQMAAKHASTLNAVQRQFREWERIVREELGETPSAGVRALLKQHGIAAPDDRAA